MMWTGRYVIKLAQSEPIEPGDLSRRVCLLLLGGLACNFAAFSQQHNIINIKAPARQHPLQRMYQARARCESSAKKTVTGMQGGILPLRFVTERSGLPVVNRQQQHTAARAAAAVAAPATAK